MKWILAVVTAILAVLVCRPVAVVLSDFDRFRRACPSNTVNAWKIKVGNACLLVTPAHVSIFPFNGKWKKSKFMDDFKDMDWRIRHQYTVAPSPQDDICWAKFHGDDSDALELEDSDIVDPMKAYVIFRQPYDMNAVWVSNESEMGVTEAILYKTPKRTLIAGDGDDPQLDDRPMLESMDVGFRGMSGAVAVNEKGKCVGMFVKRGKLISLKPPRKVTAEDTSAKYEDTVEDTVESMGFEPVPPAVQSSWIERLLFPSRSADIARMDAQFRQVDAQFRQVNAQFRQINAQFQNLNDIVLKKEDLPELGVVFDARRGLFLPSTNILSIDDATSISVEDIIGSKAPDVPRF